MIVPIDFVAGSHGNFLETVLNKYFHFVPLENSFTGLGTSHSKSLEYQKNKKFWARHWSELFGHALSGYNKIISIRFDQDDLLLLASVSLLRAADLNIDNNLLENNTRIKLGNKFYRHIITQIDQAYPFLDPTQPSIPRYVLREYFKFGFKNPNINGLWLEQARLKYHDHCAVFYFHFKDFYSQDQLVNRITELEQFLYLEFDFGEHFFQDHEKFLSMIPFRDHKQICDTILDDVANCRHHTIPPLTLFQESYINAALELAYQKEMPFHQEQYFNSTQDMLYYLDNQAPTL